MNLPHNTDAERAVLGCLLFDGEAMHRVKGVIGASDFYSGAHQILFRAIEEMVESEQPPDFILLTDILNKNGDLGKVGGASTIAEIYEATPSAANALYYAELVKQASTLRKMILGCHSVAEAARIGNLDKVRSLLRELVDEGDTQAGGFMTIEEAAFEAQKDLARLADKKLIGLKFGIPYLDNLMLGLRGPLVYVIGARTSHGKTALALQIAANTGEKGCYVCVEGSGPQMASRMIMRELDGYDRYDILNQSLEFHHIVNAAETIARGKLIFYKGTKFDSILSGCHAAVKVHGCKFLVIDYLQRIACNVGNTIREKVLHMMHSFANMASDLNIPVIILAQINRDPEKENRAPWMRDLQESSSIEQDADNIIFIHKLSKKTYISIAKQKEGLLGSVEVKFDGKRQIFTEVDLREHGDIENRHWQD